MGELLNTYGSKYITLFVVLGNACLGVLITFINVRILIKGSEKVDEE
jgi:hypothetical protein